LLCTLPEFHPVPSRVQRHATWMAALTMAVQVALLTLNANLG
jgi:hypothetical protein